MSGSALDCLSHSWQFLVGNDKGIPAGTQSSTRTPTHTDSYPYTQGYRSFPRVQGYQPATGLPKGMSHTFATKIIPQSKISYKFINTIGVYK